MWRLGVIKISLLKIFIVGCCSVLLIAWFTIVLRGEKISNISIINIFKYILYGQGNSIGVPLYYLEYKDFLDTRIQLPFILENWISFFTDSFHKGSYYIALLANKNNVEGGLGETVFVELLNLHLILSLPISFFLGNILKLVEQDLLKNRFQIPLLLLISQWIFVIPRFAILNFLDLYGICELFITFLMYLFFRNSKYFLVVKKYA